MISVILSGGSGTRLWPVSRNKFPKQFCDLFVESLFVKTSRRLQNFGEVQVCTSQEMMGLTEKSIREEGLKITHALYEPFGRNTAPAVALVCQNLVLQGKQNEIVGIFPSDHWVEKMDVFTQALNLAQKCAEKGQVVTVGIKPDHPATGFGYIETDNNQFFEEDGTLKAFQVKAFREKPDHETAQAYVNSGQFHWNSGMFVFACQTMIDAFKKYMPEMWGKIEKLNADLSNLEEIYKELTPQSLDYGIMEHLNNQVCVPCDIGWSDLGSWDDVAKIEGSEMLNNRRQEVTVDSENCFTYSSSEKVVALNGVKDLIVIDTEDALTILKKGQSQGIKELHAKISELDSDLATTHVFEHRPWGMYQNLWEEEGFKSKVITVSAGQQLSYQSHKKRAEIWVIVEGQGEVILNDETIPVAQGVVVNIPQGAKHRMRNTGSKDLKFVEVQLGTYFGEDDIIRYQDDYKRV